MRKVFRFYDEVEVEKFLLTYNFIYKIPKLKEGCYYQVRIEDNKIVYAVMKAFVIADGCTFREFYDCFNMTYKFYGVTKERFKIDPILVKKVAEKN